jgi:hypothetical protein
MDIAGDILFLHLAALLLHIHIQGDELRTAAYRYVECYAGVSSRRRCIATTATATASPSATRITAAATSNSRYDCNERDKDHDCSRVAAPQSQWSKADTKR